MTGSLQEKNGKYYLVVNLKDDLGKRHLKWINTNLDVKGNKKRAEQMLRNTLKEFEDQQMVYTKKPLFVDFLLEWLEMMRSAIKQNIWDSYQFVMVRHVIPFFTPLGVTLQDLQPVHLQRFYNSELADGRSPNTVIKYHTNIHKALDYALKLNLIPYNPSNTYVKNDYICKWDDGRPVTPDYVTRTFHKLLLDNALPPIRFHDLRHSAASLLLNLGFSLKDIQEWLGHGDIGTTADIYAHLQYKAKIGMADKLSKALSAPIPANPHGKPLENHLE